MAVYQLCFNSSSVEEQTDGNVESDGWIDTTRGRTHEYDDYGDDTESNYFSEHAAQGQKRKKAPFFKYAKKKKGFPNKNTNSKGSVVCVSHFIIYLTRSFSEVLCQNIKSHSWNHFFSSLCARCGFVDSVVATATINRGHHPAREAAQKLNPSQQAVAPETQHPAHRQAGDQASWPSRPHRPARGLSLNQPFHAWARTRTTGSNLQESAPRLHFQTCWFLPVPTVCFNHCLFMYSFCHVIWQTLDYFNNDLCVFCMFILMYILI